MPTPDRVSRAAFRVGVVEKLATDALVFLSDRSPRRPGRPVDRRPGRLVETRKYPTKYPHILIVRVDLYQPGASMPESIEWSGPAGPEPTLYQPDQSPLDTANLTVDLLRFVHAVNGSRTNRFSAVLSGGPGWCSQPQLQRPRCRGTDQLAAGAYGQSLRRTRAVCGA